MSTSTFLLRDKKKKPKNVLELNLALILNACTTSVIHFILALLLTWHKKITITKYEQILKDISLGAKNSSVFITVGLNPVRDCKSWNESL